MASPRRKHCLWDDVEFTPTAADPRFCSVKCRMKWNTANSADSVERSGVGSSLMEELPVQRTIRRVNLSVIDRKKTVPEEDPLNEYLWWSVRHVPPRYEWFERDGTWWRRKVNPSSTR